VVNLAWVKTIVYVPGGSAGTRYVPTSLVTVVNGTIRASLATAMLTPGSPVDEGSVTWPAIVPVPPPTTWALTIAGGHQMQTSVATKRPRRDIERLVNWR
jgi:hypothetical protein